MRKLTICMKEQDLEMQIPDDRVTELIAKDILYECGDETDHDLHLNPEKKFNYSEVELLLVVIEGVVE